MGLSETEQKNFEEYQSNKIKPRLSFNQQCQLLAALRFSDYRSAVIQYAFEVSQNTVSNISVCPDMKRNRYARVAREWHELGSDAFKLRYYTEDLRDRLAEGRIKWAHDNNRVLLT